MKKRVADIVVETLIKHGITNAFSVVGGGSMHLNNAFALARNEIKTIYNHHEQACAMAAETYARITGKMAAVCVTSGPGGLNTYNGVQGAYVDSIPMIVISGHPRYETTVEATGLDLRCRGVQENDAVAQVKTITKYSKLVTDPYMIKAEVEYAIKTAMSGRRGPVWLSIPLEVQGAVIEEDELKDDLSLGEIESIPTIQDSDIEALYAMLKDSERPCILTGSGIRAADAYEDYKRFISFTKLPIVGGYGDMDCNAVGDNLYYGKSGSIGPRCGNFILQNADLILVLGNSLSTTQTGFNVEAFAPHAQIIMVDAQADEAKKPGLSVDLCINADLKDFFKYVNEKKTPVEAGEKWVSFCDYLYKELPQLEVLDMEEIHDKDSLVHPVLFWEKLSHRIDDNAIIALGNSSCNQGPIQGGRLSENQRIAVNVNCGSMGDDLPSAIGAACANAPVYCITGDGSIMMNLQELQTIKYNKMPIKIILFSNHGYDNIRNTCKKFFDGLGNGCDENSGISFPSFEKVAYAFDYEYYHLKTVGDIDNAIDWLISREDSCILEVEEIPAKPRRPVIASVLDENGQFVTPPLHIMTPLMSDEELQKYMLS